jgi:hypothetical protein
VGVLPACCFLLRRLGREGSAELEEALLWYHWARRNPELCPREK